MVALADLSCGPELEVRWMASGDVSCRIKLCTSTLQVCLRERVAECAGLPQHEVRLFHEGREVAPHTLVGDMLSDMTSAHCIQSVELVRCATDPRNTDLAHFYSHAAFGTLEGVFTHMGLIAQAIHGDVHKYIWEGCDVAVKKMPNGNVHKNRGLETNSWDLYLEQSNTRCQEDALNEIAVLSYLNAQQDLPVYILRMLGCFHDATHTWLVTEYAEGGELFLLAADQGSALEEETIKRYTRQLLQAVTYLHAHYIGHRDLSLENVLLKDGRICLVDFGMAVQSHSSMGQELRYFCRVGKDRYRAPECYVPSGGNCEVLIPANFSGVTGDVVSLPVSGYFCQVRLRGDVIPGSSCQADMWGYAAQPADVFACGVSLFSLAWRTQPWTSTVLQGPQKCELFNFVHARGDAGIEALLDHWAMSTPSARRRLPQEAMDMMVSMIRSDPLRRPTAMECLSSPWFADLATMKE